MFELISQNIPDVKLLRYDRFADDRGFFSEAFRMNTFADLGLPVFVQDNISRSHRLVLRGLHYQVEPVPQGKLVSCLEGYIFDVAVDIRKSSPTFSKYVCVCLRSDYPSMLYVPPGFAHGFLALSEMATVYYKTTNYFSKQHDRSIRWNDPDINIDWSNFSPKISEKDSSAPFLKDAEVFE